MTKKKVVRALIVDDESLSRQVIREYLGSHPEIEILGECANGFDAVKEITEQNPDLVFLDIQMPKLNGFEVLALVDKNMSVIFITAFDHYALKAFDVHAIDYLLKPFSQQRFDEALERALRDISAKKHRDFHVAAAAAQPADRIQERVLVREGSQVHVLPAETIDYVEAQDDYIRIQAGGKSFLKQQRLSELEEALDHKKFVRIHRSYILNIDRMAKIELYAKDSRIVILKDGTKLNVSRSGYEKLRGLL
ncbi:response regulator [bacterium]|nr:response regulator [bacterium]